MENFSKFFFSVAGYEPDTMRSSRPVLLRPLLLCLIFLHASAYVLRKRTWNDDLSDALQILEQGGGGEAGNEFGKPVWGGSRSGFYQDYDEGGDRQSARLDAAENRLLLETFLNQDAASLGESPAEEDFPDEVNEVPLLDDLEDVPLSPNNPDVEVPVDNSEIESILQPSDDSTAEIKEAKREYDPTSLVKKTPQEVKIMATLTPAEVNECFYQCLITYYFFCMKTSPIITTD